jgi:hypothetical protein
MVLGISPAVPSRAAGRFVARRAKDAMFVSWMRFAVDAAMLCQQTQQVMGLRLLKLARGGSAGRLEAQRMVAEKGFAFAEAAGSLATGGSMERVVRRYRSHVRANKRRLTRS